MTIEELQKEHQDYYKSKREGTLWNSCIKETLSSFGSMAIATFFMFSIICLVTLFSMIIQ